ncbi:MAG: ComEC/Rec2 family competence protein [Patescibacteria group bacterium]
MHSSVRLSFLGLSFLGGVALASFIPAVSAALLWVILLGTVILCVSVWRGTFGDSREGVRRRLVGVLIGLCILAFASGMWRFDAVATLHSRLAVFADRRAGDAPVSFLFHGFVDGAFTSRGNNGSFSFYVTAVQVENRIVPIRERVLVETGPLPLYAPGTRMGVEGSVSVAGERDTWLLRDGIRMKLDAGDIRTYEHAPYEISTLQRIRMHMLASVISVRSLFERAIRASIGEPASALIEGVLLGTRQFLPDTLREAFRATGMTHILAVSGYNISVVGAGVLALLLRWVRRRRAFWFTLGVLAIFTIMTGASASVVRAAIMGGLLFFAQSYGRLPYLTNALILAACAMVLAQPFVLRYDVGFQLSFLAVIGLSWGAPLIMRFFEKTRIPDIVREPLAATLAAQIAVLPLILVVFGSLSIAAPLANILTVPVVPFVMAAGFFAGVVALIIPPLAPLVGIPAWIGASYILWVIERIAELPGASVGVSLPWWGGVVLAVGIWGVWKYLSRLYAPAISS